MKMFTRPDDEGEVLAYFGKARLVKKLDGKLELMKTELLPESGFRCLVHEAVVRERQRP
jgi:hypothetical protein